MTNKTSKTNQAEKGKVYKFKEAHAYINERLNLKWSNPERTFESAIYRGVITPFQVKGSKRAFTQDQLDAFIKAKNESASPLGGLPKFDLTPYEHMFGDYSDRQIALTAGCSLITVFRYRQHNEIPSKQETHMKRVMDAIDRIGVDPDLALSKELGVSRALVSRIRKQKEAGEFADQQAQEDPGQEDEPEAKE